MAHQNIIVRTASIVICYFVIVVKIQVSQLSKLTAYILSTVLLLKNDINGSNSYFFNRSYSEFLQPFGNPDSQYWFGLERLYQLAGWPTYRKLDVQCQAIDGTNFSASYFVFQVYGAQNHYQLIVMQDSIYSAIDEGMSVLGNTFFTTYDSNNDYSSSISGTNCAVELGGGFWYRSSLTPSCANTRLTGSPSDNFQWYKSSTSTWIQLSEVQVSFSLIHARSWL